MVLHAQWKEKMCEFRSLVRKYRHVLGDYHRWVHAQEETKLMAGCASRSVLLYPSK